MPDVDGLLTPPDVQRLLRDHELAPRKSAGQNFVVDPNTVRRIVDAAGLAPTDTVLEIGPGLGSLTRLLVQRVATVVAVELDTGFVELLAADEGLASLASEVTLIRSGRPHAASDGPARHGAAVPIGGGSPSQDLPAWARGVSSTGGEGDRTPDRGASGTAATVGSSPPSGPEAAHGRAMRPSSNEARGGPESSTTGRTEERSPPDEAASGPDVDGSSASTDWAGRDRGDGVQQKGGASLVVVHGDALTTDHAALLDGPTRVVANLPYNVATPIVMTLLAVPQVVDQLVMVQKEVALRWAAGVGDAAYGAVSVKLALAAEVEIAFPVSRQVFVPVPNVDSVMVAVRHRPDGLAGDDRGRVFAVVEAAFAQRRKTLRNNLRAVADVEAVEAACAAAGVDPGDRADACPPEVFVALAGALPGPLG